MDIQEYIDQKRQLENNILEFLDHKSINDIGELKETLVKQKIFDDENEFRSFLHLIQCISKNYHRTKCFFDKIDSILSLFKTEFQKYLTNSEIFNILKCKRILLFLFENKILNFDYYVIDKLKPSIPYFYNFLNDMKPFLDDEQLSQIQDKLPDMSLDDFKLNQKNGENEKLICNYMRNDMVEDFIRLINQTNLSLETTIDESIFETNAFLIDKEPTLIEYATFFGSLQIVKYLQLNNIELASSLWMYAIHGRNAEIIHLLEENHVQPEDKTYKKVLLEAIKCNHNELVDYIMNNYIENVDESVYNESFQSYNYSYFPKNVFTQYYFNQLCVFGYYYIVSLMIEKYKFDVNFEVQIIYDDCSYVLTPLLSAITYDHYNIAILILQYTNDGINFKSSKNFFHKYFYKYNSIFHAIYNNNTKLLNALLSQNKINVNDEQYSYGFIDGQEKTIKYIPLVEAVENKQYEIIKLLLSHPKIDVNLRDEKQSENLITKYTALCSATENDNIKIIELLLSNNNININKSSILQSSNREWKITCLISAVSNQNTEIIKLLVANPKIDVNKLSKEKFDDTEYNMTPLYLSVFDDTIEIAKILLSNSKINVNKESTTKTKKSEIIETPLNLAIKHQNKEIIELLLKYPKIDVNKIAITSEEKFLSKEINKEHILHTAVNTGNAEIVNLILNQPNIDINCKSISEKILNIYDDNPEIEIEQNSALHLAIFEENEDLVSLLISNDKIKINQKGINFYNGTKFKWTSLTMAIFRNQFDICQKLLSHPDIDVNSIFKVTYKESATMNKSALFLAVEKGYEDIVDILLLHPNIDVNSKEILKDKDNTHIEETFVLHKAIEKGNINIIKSLLNCQSIDLNVKSVKSVILKDSIEVEYKTTMIYAIELSNVEIVQILLSKENFDLNSRSTKFHSTDYNFNEENDLLKAALNNKEILKILLDHLFAKNRQLIPKDMKAYLSMTNDEEIKEIIFNANKKSEYQLE